MMVKKLLSYWRFDIVLVAYMLGHALWRHGLEIPAWRWTMIKAIVAILLMRGVLPFMEDGVRVWLEPRPGEGEAGIPGGTPARTS